MRAKFVLCFVLTQLSCSLANRNESCNDCMGFTSCKAAVEAMELRSDTTTYLFRSAFCGFLGIKFPMVCCSKFTSMKDSLAESHPNLYLLPDNCGDITVQVTAKVGGGITAGLYEFPWMAMIIYETRLGLRVKCCGSIINRLYVLTAAHCIADLEPLEVRIGEYDVNSRTESKTQDILIEEAISHPEYLTMPAMKNDIGLLRLKKPINFWFKNAGPICLPVSLQLQSRNVGGLSGTVAGWGYTEHGNYASSKLLTVDVPIHTAEICRNMYNRGNKPGEEDSTINKICAGAEGKDSCDGDSGGPLMVLGAYKSAGTRFIQHGIVSYGPKLCGAYFPSIYTDVSKYMKWILDTIEP